MSEKQPKRQTVSASTEKAWAQGKEFGARMGFEFRITPTGQALMKHNACGAISDLAFTDDQFVIGAIWTHLGLCPSAPKTRSRSNEGD